MKNLRTLFITFVIFLFISGCQTVKQKTDAAIEKENEAKAALMYSEIDRNPLFDGFAAKEDRSTMNATFTLNTPELKDTFEAMAKEAGLNGINGHRSVGGYRASMYNALPIASVQALVDVMKTLEQNA